MKTKKLLTQVVESLINGDHAKAEKFFNAHITEKSSRHLNEGRYHDAQYDYDHPSWDVNQGDDDPGWDDEKEDMKDTVILQVDGHAVEVFYTGAQAVKSHGEESSRHDPGWSEVYEWGPVTIEEIGSIKVNNHFIFDGCDPINGVTADDMNKNPKVYAMELYNLTSEEEDWGGPLPPELSSLLTPDFFIKIIAKFAKYLESKEGR